MTTRRELLGMMAAAGGCLALPGCIRPAEAAAEMMYDPPRFGNLSLLQIGDTHAQLNPSFYREPGVNLGLGEAANLPPYLTGEHFLEHFRVIPQSLRAHALSNVNFTELAHRYGPSGGYAYLATVIKGLRASRPDSLLLDCGDSLRGSATSMWTRSADMVAATRLLGVDAMTGDSEFSLGAERLRDIFSRELHGRTALLAHNLQSDGSIPLPARPYAIYFIAGVPVAVIGMAYPHFGRSEIRSPIPGWRFGFDEAALQKTVDTVRGRGAKLVVLLSHAGIAFDLKLASRIQGIDVILGGHSQDALPEPLVVRNGTERTLVSHVGAYGKFCGVLDLDLRNGQLRDYRFHLVPIFSQFISADPEMAALISEMRRPSAGRLDSVLAETEVTLFRRGNFYGSLDQIVLDAMLAARDADIAFAPGMRTGSTILPGERITLERLLEHLSVDESGIRVERLTGRQIRDRLEGWLEDTFSADPYLRSGEDMVRVSGLRYVCRPGAPRGARVGEVSIRGKAISDSAVYRTVSWGLGGEGTAGNDPVWTVVADYLRQLKVVRELSPSPVVVEGIGSNRGWFDLG